MVDQKSPNYETMGEILAGYINYVSEYIEKIGDENPIPFYNETVAKMRIIQKKIIQIKSPFLIEKNVRDLYDAVLSIVITWNNDIAKNVRNYVDAHIEIAKNAFEKKDNYNPMKIIINERDRFLNADTVFEQVLRKINSKMMEEVELYALFFALISSQEVMEKTLYAEISGGIKKFDIKNYDLTDMFSVTGKWKDSDGYFKTDSKVIRNSLSHFDFELVRDQGLIIFHPKSQDVDVKKTFTLREFLKYVSNSSFFYRHSMCHYVY